MDVQDPDILLSGIFLLGVDQTFHDSSFQACRAGRLGNASDPEMRRDVGVMPAIQGMIEAPEVKLVR
jgi:hypothetical protein